MTCFMFNVTCSMEYFITSMYIVFLFPVDSVLSRTDHPWHVIYEFVANRIQAIRQDITFQVHTYVHTFNMHTYGTSSIIMLAHRNL